MMAAPGGVEALSGGALVEPYPAAESALLRLIAPLPVEAYPLPKSETPTSIRGRDVPISRECELSKYVTAGGC
jgi:hypothetical protein